MKKCKPFAMQAPKAIADTAGESGFRVACNLMEDESAELLIFDQIGEGFFSEGVSASAVVSFLAENRGRTVRARINSFGGSAYDGMVIYNALATHDAEVVTVIEGIAYSAASYIALASDRVEMFKNADIGIHRASIMAWGNRHEMEATRDWLDKIDDHIVDMYQDKTGQDRDKIVGWLDGVSDGTVFSAKEAVDLGFADVLLDPKKGKGSSSSKAESAGAASRMQNSRSMSAANRLAMRRLRGGKRI